MLAIYKTKEWGHPLFKLYNSCNSTTRIDNLNRKNTKKSILFETAVRLNIEVILCYNQRAYGTINRNGHKTIEEQTSPHERE